MLNAVYELYKENGLLTHGHIEMDDIIGFNNNCSNEIPLWVLDISEMDKRDSKHGDLHNIGSILHKLMSNIKDSVIGSLISDMINNNKMLTVDYFIDAFDELYKDGLLHLNDCRCSVPFSHNYISFDDPLP